MISGGKVKSAFLFGLTLTVCCASTVLALAEGVFFPVGLTPFIALAAWQFSERQQWIVLPLLAANGFGVLAVVAAGAELAFGTVEARILSGAHLIVYLTWIVLFMRKQDRQYWWLVALSVLQLAVCSVLTKSSSLGFALIMMLFLLVWTLSLFSLHRLRVRASQPGNDLFHIVKVSSEQPITIHHGIQMDPGMNWIGLRFKVMILGMCLASLVMSGVAFAAFPRVFVGTPSLLSDLSSETPGLIQKTGFRERVKLGEFGPILQSDERVLRIETFDQITGNSIPIEQFADQMNMEELLLRGPSMGWYTGGEWSRGLSANDYNGEQNRPRFSRSTATENCFRVEITQDSPIGTFAFVPTPIIGAQLINASGKLIQRSLSNALVFDIIPGNLRQDETTTNFNKTPISYEVYCTAPEVYAERNPPVEVPEILGQWLYPNADPQPWRQAEERYARTLSVTDDLSSIVPNLYARAQALQPDGGVRLSPDEYAQRVVSLLRDSGEYQYSLNVQPTDTSLDPVDDFLINHKTGHCQYFASAGALMLQSVGIPARIVSGFKGSELNVISGEAEVNQKHAHVWIEYRHQKRWHSIDPTPGSRNELLANADNKDVLGDIQEAISDLWDAGVSNVTPESQRAAIQPLLAVFKDAATKIRQVGLIGAIKVFVNDLLSNPSKWISWRVLVGGLICLLPLALLLRKRPWRWIRSALGWLSNRWSPQRRTATHIVRFYETFRKACARSGLVFHDSNTARENAASAIDFFREKLPTNVQPIPNRLAEAFNSVRYGQYQLTPEETDKLGRDVLQLTAAISTQNGRHR
jgi:hypothetical protein